MSTDDPGLSRPEGRATDGAFLRVSTDALLDPLVLLEATRDSSGQVDDFLYRDINQATCDYLGLTREELIGRGVVETMPGIKDALLPGFIRCLDTGEPLILNDFSYDNEVLADRRRYDLRATRATPKSITLTWRDVTERFEATERLAVSEQNFRLLAENAGDAVAHFREGRVVWASPSVEAVLGAPPEYWLGRSVLEFVPEEDVSINLVRLARLAEGGTVVERLRVIGADGVTHWINLHAKPFFDADGQPDGEAVTLVLADQDVAAEEALEEARSRQAASDELYRRTVESAAVAMCLARPEGVFFRVNVAMCEFFGYDAPSLLQKTWMELTAEEYLQADLDKFADLVAGRIDSYRLVQQFIHADGHPIWGDLSVGCLRRADGSIECTIGQIIDITARVEADERNRVLAQELRQQSDRVTAELATAAAYMASIMPRGLQGPVTVSSRYLPSRELGGDCLDYYWIDDDHLLIKLIDVSGHGLEPALLAVSVHNLMRSGSLVPETALSPEAVLTELNRVFAMDRHNDHYFTMWYGIYQPSTRTLRYASAGAPPALAFNPATGAAVAVTELSTKTPPVGVFEDTEFTSHTYQVPPGCRMLIYSDGASEITLADGQQMAGAAFKDLTSRVAASPDWSLDDLIDELHALTPAGVFEDDCSLIQAQFD